MTKGQELGRWDEDDKRWALVPASIQAEVAELRTEGWTLWRVFTPRAGSGCVVVQRVLRFRVLSWGDDRQDAYRVWRKAVGEAAKRRRFLMGGS